MKYEDKPIEVGHYWVKNWLSSKPARIIKVWAYNSNPEINELFTSDDCGASVDDEYYDNYRWYGPLEVPPAL